LPLTFGNCRSVEIFLAMSKSKTDSFYMALKAD
jgi:hypothetical protein